MPAILPRDDPHNDEQARDFSDFSDFFSDSSVVNSISLAEIACLPESSNNLPSDPVVALPQDYYFAFDDVLVNTTDAFSYLFSHPHLYPHPYSYLHTDPYPHEHHPEEIGQDTALSLDSNISETLDAIPLDMRDEPYCSP